MACLKLSSLEWRRGRSMVMGAIVVAGLAGGARDSRADMLDDLRKKLGDVEGQARKAIESLVPRIERDVCYGEVEGRKLLLDVHLPPGHDPSVDKPRPAIIVVHGGGWSSGSRNEPVCGAIALALVRDKFVIFNIDYRLVEPPANGRGPKNMFPAAFDDCQRAVRWVRANAPAYGVKASRIGAIGASAGGHLVSLLGTRPTRDNSDPVLAGYSSRVQAVVTVFGPADLTRDFSHLKFGGGSVQDLVDHFAGKGPESRAREASPIFHVNDRTAPVLIFHGDRDDVVPVDQARDFHAALKAAGCESRYIEFAGEGHNFRKPETLARFHRETSAFFKRHLLSAPRGDDAPAPSPSTAARAE